LFDDLLGNETHAPAARSYALETADTPPSG
jgi:hypothetical protein